MKGVAQHRVNLRRELEKLGPLDKGDHRKWIREAFTLVEKYRIHSPRGVKSQTKKVMRQKIKNCVEQQALFVDGVKWDLSIPVLRRVKKKLDKVAAEIISTLVFPKRSELWRYR